MSHINSRPTTGQPASDQDCGCAIDTTNAVCSTCSTEDCGQRNVLYGRVLISLGDILTITGLGRTTVYEEIWAGRLLARKVGRRTVFHTEDVRAWLAALPSYKTNIAA